jgi:hypothetical protein
VLVDLARQVPFADLVGAGVAVAAVGLWGLAVHLLAS